MNSEMTDKSIKTQLCIKDAVKNYFAKNAERVNQVMFETPSQDMDSKREKPAPDLKSSTNENIPCRLGPTATHMDDDFENLDKINEGDDKNSDGKQQEKITDNVEDINETLIEVLEEVKNIVEQTLSPTTIDQLAANLEQDEMATVSNNSSDVDVTTCDSPTTASTLKPSEFPKEMDYRNAVSNIRKRKKRKSRFSHKKKSIYRRENGVENSVLICMDDEISSLPPVIRSSPLGSTISKQKHSGKYHDEDSIEKIHQQIVDFCRKTKTVKKQGLLFAPKPAPRHDINHSREIQFSDPNYQEFQRKNHRSPTKIAVKEAFNIERYHLYQMKQRLATNKKLLQVQKDTSQNLKDISSYMQILIRHSTKM